MASRICNPKHIKGCPICGQPPVVERVSVASLVSISCEVYSPQLGYYPHSVLTCGRTMAAAVKRWNTRVS